MPLLRASQRCAMGNDNTGSDAREDRPVDPGGGPTLVFMSRDRVTPAIEICVNFGIFAGRTVTSAEIDRLARWLLDEVEAVTVISEQRHEIGKSAEASTHQVRIEIGGAGVATARAGSRETLEKRLLERVDYWARTCIAERHAEI